MKNEYLIANKKLMKEWDYDKNKELNLEKITSSSSIKAWWICSKGHKWESTVSNRTNGRNCPYCMGKKVLKGYNDLATINPLLVKEWNYNKNINITPDNIMPNSNKKVWWICSKGHEWEATCLSRNREKTGCPYCSGNKVLKGFNDFGTLFPELISEWNQEKNIISPYEITANSSKKVWWKCQYLHEWKVSVSHRSRGSMCPKCQSEKQTSFPEQAVLYYLKKLGLQCLSRYKLDDLYEIDIFISEYNIGIEYDGGYFHGIDKQEKENIKNEYIKEKDIHLIRIKEDINKSKYCEDIDFIKVYKNKFTFDYNRAIFDVIKRISKLIRVNLNIEIDVEKDRIDIMTQYKQYLEKNSLKSENSQIAKEWNYKKNITLKPEMFLSQSNQKVWWICSKGHEWEAKISDRTNGNGCPYCSNKKLLKGYNDLATLNPILVKEWDWEKNNPLTPSTVFSSSHQKVWWICPNCLHKYYASIAHRTNGRGCPKCKLKTLSTKNTERFFDAKKSLIKTNPELMKEWNYKKNLDVNPEKLIFGSKKKVWWICSKGHEWENVIANRTIHNQNCPYCSNQKILKGYNDLETLNPQLAEEWNYSKNIKLPSEVGIGSAKKVWWICSQCNYEWEMAINYRIKGGKCPNCKKNGRF